MFSQLKQQYGGPELQIVTVTKRSPVQNMTIDTCAIRAAQILQHKLFTSMSDFSVLAGHFTVVKPHTTAYTATDHSIPIRRDFISRAAVGSVYHQQ